MHVKKDIILKEEEYGRNKKSPQGKTAGTFASVMSGADTVYDFLINSSQFIADLVIGSAEQIFMSTYGIFFQGCREAVVSAIIFHFFLIPWESLLIDNIISENRQQHTE